MSDRRSRRAAARSEAAAPREPERDLSSPLAWLARRKDKDGRPMLSDAEFDAGEKLRADFWFAQMTPRVTANWSMLLSAGGSQRGAARPWSRCERFQPLRRASASGVRKSCPTQSDQVASIAWASDRMRFTIEARPFERCCVRCSRRPNSEKIPSASVSVISARVLPS